MENGKPLEVEIRGVSIWAVELIKDLIVTRMREKSSKNIPINSILIDFFLWDYRRENVEAVDKAVPYHKVRCIYY